MRYQCKNKSRLARLVTKTTANSISGKPGKKMKMTVTFFTILGRFNDKNNTLYASDNGKCIFIGLVGVKKKKKKKNTSIFYVSMNRKLQK
jgi:hypothetical protein